MPLTRRADPVLTFSRACPEGTGECAFEPYGVGIALVPWLGTLFHVEELRSSGATLSENRQRKAAGLERDAAPMRPEGERQVKLLGARIACVFGILLGVGGIIAALLGGGANISAGAVGAALSVVGYFLGARRLATGTIVLCMAAIFFGLAASQGYIPGIEASDHNLPKIQPSVDDQ